MTEVSPDAISILSFRYGDDNSTDHKGMLFLVITRNMDTNASDIA